MTTPRFSSDLPPVPPATLVLPVPSGATRPMTEPSAATRPMPTPPGAASMPGPLVATPALPPLGGRPPHPVPLSRPTNGLAVASLVTALCGLVLLPIIFGHVALGQVRARGEDGAGLAVAGLILGWLQFAAIAVFLVAVAWGGWALWTS